MSPRRRLALALLTLALAWPAGVRAQGVLAPTWLSTPPLPEAWVLRSAADDRALFQCPGGELRVVLGAKVVAPAEDSAYATIAAGRWVKGRLVTAPDGGVTFSVSVASAQGDVAMTASAKKAGPAFGQALELIAGLRFEGDTVAAPDPLLDLSERPEARINPVGLFVSLPDGWRPKLDKKTGVFTLQRKKVGGTLVFTKAAGSVLRDLRDAGRVAKAYPGFDVEPLYWQAPGAFRSWRLHKKEGDAVVVEELHLVRFKKLDDWSYHLVHVMGFPVDTGLAPARSVLARIKIIP